MNKGIHVLERRSEWREEQMNTQRKNDRINMKMSIYNQFRGEYTLTYQPVLWEITKIYRNEDFCGMYLHLEYLYILNTSCEFRRNIYNDILSLNSKKSYANSKIREVSWINISWLCHTETFFETKMKYHTIEILDFYSSPHYHYDLYNYIYQNYAIYPTAISNSKKIKYENTKNCFTNYYLTHFTNDILYSMIDVFICEYIEYIDGLSTYIKNIEDSISGFIYQYDSFPKKTDINNDITIHFGTHIYEILEFHKKIIKIVIDIIYDRLKNKLVRKKYDMEWICHILEKYKHETVFPICYEKK